MNYENKFVIHNRLRGCEPAFPAGSPLPLLTLCPNSGLIDLNAEADFGVWEVNGGLPTLGKGHR